MTPRRFLQGITPPVVWRALAPALKALTPPGASNGISFEGDFRTWNEAASRCTGYADRAILDKVLAATLKVKRGEAAFERDSIVFDRIEYSWPLLASLMWAAARGGGKLNVLDFGGALGSTYFQNRRFLQAIADLHWNVVEQPHYVEAGRRYIQDDHLEFHTNIEECLRDHRVNAVLLGSVLQYLKSPFECTSLLSRLGADVLIVDRTPFSTRAEDRLMIQRVPPSIYRASYPMWCFSQRVFLRALGAHWRLVESQITADGSVHLPDGFRFSFQCLIMEAVK